MSLNLPSQLASVLVLVSAYLVGALPFAVWVGRIKGVDPRSRGSKNPGASNVARTLGVKWGLLTLALDAGKGALATLMSPQLFALLSVGAAHTTNGELNLLPALAAFASVLGHTTSPFLRGKGGRGVATTGGALVALHTGLGLLCALAWALVLLITQTPAWASLCLAVLMVTLSLRAEVAEPTQLFALLSATLIVVRHWSHIKRLLSPRSL